MMALLPLSMGKALIHSSSSIRSLLPFSVSMNGGGAVNIASPPRFQSMMFRAQQRHERHRQTLQCGSVQKDKQIVTWRPEEKDRDHTIQMFGSDDDFGTQVPTQAQTLVEGPGTLLADYKPTPDIDYLQELLAIQQEGPRSIGFFGTRNMGFMHQQLIEILSYAMVITKNHIYTSGASGTNAAVIRGALRAEKPELLTVILPQSLKKQSPESQELLAKVKNLIEKPQNDHLPLIEASRC